ncbi:PucR family transcriptional regulator [Alkalibacillus silvisoli]|uniref:PucR family transcriptional regulator n=1 Tax=Alkalibacillus silvisoli TaxID=392823 RepID=A0ABN0ZJ08_9BACI
MIEQLQALYPSMTQLNQPTDGYITFVIHGTMYGIPTDSLTEESETLLKTLLPNQIKSQEEQAWLHFLTGESTVPPAEINAFRIVALMIKSPYNQSLLKETMEDVLSKPLIFIWEDNQTPIMLEPLEESEEALQFHEVIDILSSDLELKLAIFQSEVYQEIDTAPALFNWVRTVAFDLLKHTRQSVITQSDALIPKMITSLTEDDAQVFVSSVLKEAVSEPELLETIQTVIQHQVNISVVAKSLYMHRNTVQKRIDKFHELSGLDVRKFEDGVKAYICIKYLL